MREVDGIKAYTASDHLDVLPTACTCKNLLWWGAKTDTEKNESGYL